MHDVQGSAVQARLRSQLSGLLDEALDSLTGSGGDRLERFVEVIERDQRRRHPKIPPELATAWRTAASSILASLTPSSDQDPGRDVDQDPGRAVEGR